MSTDPTVTHSGSRAGAQFGSSPRIYVASSWRNIDRVKVAARWLRAHGFSVYDFTEDDDQGAAFNWTDIDADWTGWNAERFREQLWHPVADRGFNRDFNELRNADGLLLMLPCGRSAHLELGYAIGAGKPTAVVLVDGEPELMYRAVGHLCLDLTEAVDYFTQEFPGWWPTGKAEIGGTTSRVRNGR